MKKYTNKILIITAALLFAAGTIFFFVKASEIKQEIIESSINQ